MNIAIIGYGKMGKEIEKIALERGHTVSLKITSKNKSALNSERLNEVDVAIEFSSPEVVLSNIYECIDNHVPLVVGTTGWYNDFENVTKRVKESNSSLLHATNCSLGVNIFFKVNEVLAKIMNNQKDYDVSIDEVHHVHKLDAPSGTALTLAEGIINNTSTKQNWVNNASDVDNELVINSHRIDDVPGTHTITYSSEIDDIEIKHTAHNRKGFALGAVVAAEYIHNKKGIFTMNDVLFN